MPVIWGNSQESYLRKKTRTLTKGMGKCVSGVCCVVVCVDVVVVVVVGGDRGINQWGTD